MSVIDDWSNPRIQELMGWRRHHEACIREIDEKIRREREYKNPDLNKLYKELEDEGT